MNFSMRDVWLLVGLSLATGAAVAADGPETAPAVRLDGERLSLRVEHLPLGELLAALERSGRVRVDVRGDPAGVAVSDSFDETDVAKALRRVLSAHSHVLIDREATQRTPRVIELILLGSRDNAGAEPDPHPDRFIAGGEFEGSVEAQPRAEALVDVALAAASGEERAAVAEQLAYHDDLAGREYAREVLTERPAQKARGRLRRALADSDRAVSRRAGELIEEWHLEDQ